MRVGAAGNRPHTLRGEPVRESLGVSDDLTCVVSVGGGGGLPQRHRLGRDRVHERAALAEREHRLVDPLGQLLAAEDHSTPRPTQDLVSSETDHVGIGHRAGDGPARHQTDEVRGIDHQPCPDLVGDRAEGGEVNQPGIRGGATDNHFRSMLTREVANLVIVDHFGVFAHPVGDDIEPLPAEVDPTTMSKMTAVRQRHRQHGVTGRE